MRSSAWSDGCALTSASRCEWFKLFLTPEALHNNRPDPRLPALPYGKSPEDVVVDFLTCLWSYAKEKISDELGSVADLESADVVLTVPSAWDAKGCSVVRVALSLRHV